MFVYLLNSSICLAIFSCFYKLFLEKENIHLIKRFYLIAALFLAFGIPLITFTSYVEQAHAFMPQLSEEMGNFNTNNTPLPISEINYMIIISWSIYIVGVLFFGIRFCYNLLQIHAEIKYNPKVKLDSFTHVLLQDLVIPHTFFKYMFFNKLKFETHQIPKEVFWHEQAHATQKHSLDVLFIELLKVVFWFNPLVYFIKHAIKLNHEFLADQAVLNQGISPSTYQHLLLEFSTNKFQPSLTNAINYSSIKKRFNVMKTTTSKTAIWLKLLILLPLLAIMLFSFSQNNIVETDISKEKEMVKQYVEIDTIIENKKEKTLNPPPKKNNSGKEKELKLPPPPPKKNKTSKEKKLIPLPPPIKYLADSTKTGSTTINGETIFSVRGKESISYYNRWGEEVDKNGKKIVSNKLSTSNSSDSKAGYFKINNETFFYISKNGTTTYFDRWGEEVDKNGKKIASNKLSKLNSSASKAGYFKINNETFFYISKNETTTYFDRWGEEVDKNGKELK